jgi:hypothetical protein
MAFNGTRQDVANVVIEVIRAFHNDKTIVENTAFGKDVIIDQLARRGYAPLIVKLLVERFPECVLSGFGPDDCSGASKVKDIVDTIWNELKPA